MVDSMRLRLGKKAPLSDALRLGKKASLMDSMRLGKRSPLSNSMRLGKRPALYDSLRLGKRSTLSNSMLVRNPEEKAEYYDEVDKRAALHDSMRLGKRSWGRWLGLDKRRLLSDSLRLGKRSALFRDSLRLGKRNSEEVDICKNLLDSNNNPIKRASLDEIMRLGKRMNPWAPDMFQQTEIEPEIFSNCEQLLKLQDKSLESKESGTDKRAPLDATLRLG